MRILVLVNTPAHAHLYRHAVDRLRDRGHTVRVLARDDGCTLSVLEYYDVPFTAYGKHQPHRSPVAFVGSLASQFRRIATEAVSFSPDVVFGRGPYAAFAGTVSRAATVLVLDDEPTAINHTVSRPFANCIVSPMATRRNLGSNHLTFDGLTECAYLHTDLFKPDPTVRQELGVDPGEQYAIVRFNAHDALHDEGLRGFTQEQRRDLVTHLSEVATVLVSDEGGGLGGDDVPGRALECHPARIHDALAEAALFVCDTGTMAVEAGLVGTPSLRYRGTDRRIYGEFETLEEVGLLEQYDGYGDVRERSRAILEDPTVGDRWQVRRETVVPTFANLTDIIVDVAESRGAVERATRETPLTPRRLVRP